MSTSGNGIVYFAGEEWNIGAVSWDVVGEKVNVVLLNVPWALCVEDKVRGEYFDYATDIASRAELSSSNYSTGDKFVAKFDLVTEKKGFALIDGTIFHISNPIIEAGEYYSIQVSNIEQRYVDVELSSKQDVDSGEIKFEVRRTIGDNAVGLYKGNLVMFPSKVLNRGDIVRGGIREGTGQLSISIETLPPSAKPLEGDVITVTVHRNEVKRDSTNRTGALCFYQGIPVYIPGDSLEKGDTINVRIVRINHGEIIARVDKLPDDVLPSIGDSIKIENDLSFDETLIEDHLPFIIQSPPVDIPNTGLVYINDIHSDHIEASLNVRDSFLDKPEVGDVIRVTTTSQQTANDFVLHKNFPVLVPNSNRLSSGLDEFIVSVTAVGIDHLTGSVRALGDQHRPSVGDELVVTVIDRKIAGSICMYDDVPVFVPGKEAVSDETIRISVSDIDKDAVVGSMDGLCGDRVVPLGEVVAIPPHRSLSPPITTNEFGVDCPAPLRVPESMVGPPTRVGVSRIESDHVFASIDGLPETHQPSLGEELTIMVEKRVDQGAIGHSNEFPVFVPGQAVRPNQKIRAGVSSIQEDHIVASVDELQGNRYANGDHVIELPAPDSVTSPIQPSELSDEFPAPIRLPEKLPDIGFPVRTGVERVGSDYILASVAALPEESRPSSDDIFTAEVVNSDVDHSVLLADGVPVVVQLGRLQSGTQLQLKAVQVFKYGVEAIALSIEPRFNPEEKSISEYFYQMQQGIRELRRGSYSEAADSFHAATDTINSKSNTITLWWDAYRHATLAQCESYRQQNDLRAARDTIVQYQEKVSQLDTTEDSFIRAIQSESQIATETIEFLERIDSAVGPTLVIKVESRNKFEAVSDQISSIRNSLDDRFAQSFPHSLLNEMLGHVKSHFEYPIKSLDDYLREEQSPVELYSWIPPVPLSSSPAHMDTRKLSWTATEQSDTHNKNAETPTPELESESPVDHSIRGSENAESTLSTDSSPARVDEDQQRDPSDEVERIGTAEDSREETIQQTESEHQPELDSKTSEPPVENISQTNSSDIDPEELRELRDRAKRAATNDPSRDGVTSTTSRYIRSPAIKQYAKARASGVCEWCERPAPFQSKVGEPYLEVHHIEELGEGGSDSPDKVVALCPTCHSQIHYGKGGNEINSQVQQKLETEIRPADRENSE